MTIPIYQRMEGKRENKDWLLFLQTFTKIKVHLAIIHIFSFSKLFGMNKDNAFLTNSIYKSST